MSGDRFCQWCYLTSVVYVIIGRPWAEQPWMFAYCCIPLQDPLICFSQPTAFVSILKVITTNICWILLMYFVHVAVGPPYTLRLKVKFYSSEPNSLREELTRYQFFLQLKQDILQGRLDCAYQTAVELSALALQCEFCPTDKRTGKCTEFHECIFCDSLKF